MAKDQQMLVEEEGRIGNSIPGEESKERCVNCGGKHPMTKRNCLKRRWAQKVAREKDGTSIEEGVPMKK